MDSWLDAGRPTVTFDHDGARLVASLPAGEMSLEEAQQLGRALYERLAELREGLRLARS